MAYRSYTPTYSRRSAGSPLGNFVMLLIFLFYVAVMVASILVIVDSFMLKSAVDKNETAKIKDTSNRIFIYACILLTALIFNVLLMLSRWMMHSPR